MASPPDSPLPLLPFAQATAVQRTQALLTARQAVAAALPPYGYPQWEQALAVVRPPVQPGAAGEPARLAPAGLVALLQQLVQPPPPAQPPAPTPTAPTPPPAGEPVPPQRSRKQTYQLPDGLIAQLHRLSYWRRLPVNQLVVHALTRLVAEHPAEAAHPVPPPPPLS